MNIHRSQPVHDDVLSMAPSIRPMIIDGYDAVTILMRSPPHHRTPSHATNQTQPPCRAGFGTTVVVKREAFATLDSHAHPFEAKALVLPHDRTFCLLNPAHSGRFTAA